MDQRVLHFPHDFTFGTSVAAFQVEGNEGVRNSDWDVFLAHHPTIVKPDEIGPQWWDLTKAEPDITHMEMLGAKALRLSFEWARIEPEEGTINQDALAYYRRLITFLHHHHIEPVVTLNHYVLPEWIAQMGSWTNPKIVPAFEKYVQLITSQFTDVTTWLTINEPSVLVETAYLLPIMPPQKIGLRAAFMARNNMLMAHKRAYAVIKKAIPNSQVSIAFSFRWYRPENKKDYLETRYADFVNYLDSLNYIDSVKDTLDFIGVNFYAGYYLNLNPLKLHINVHRPHFRTTPPKTILFGEVRKPGAYVSDLGMPIVPGFFLNLLRTLHRRFNKPIIITENGIADRRDIHRAFYLLTHLVALWTALQEGVDIRQYLVWSTVDNLEWLEGYREEFGLIHVNAVTGERTPRKSAHLYRDIIESHAIHIEKLIHELPDEPQRETARRLIHHLLSEQDIPEMYDYM